MSNKQLLWALGLVVVGTWCFAIFVDKKFALPMLATAAFIFFMSQSKKKINNE